MLIPVVISELIASAGIVTRALVILITLRTFLRQNIVPVVLRSRLFGDCFILSTLILARYRKHKCPSLAIRVDNRMHSFVSYPAALVIFL